MRPVEDPPVAALSEVSKWALDYFDTVRQLMQRIDLKILEEIIQQLRLARDRGASLFLIGNGGSAATSSHFANDLAKASKQRGGSRLRIFSLTDNVAWMTALANDDGYENVFKGQLENHLSPGDILIAISASGNSPNLLEAVRLAKERKALTVALIGFEGGALRSLVDLALFIPSEPGVYGPVEDVHMMLQHLITECLRRS